MDKIKLLDRVRAGGEKTKIWEDRQMAETETEREAGSETKSREQRTQ